MLLPLLMEIERAAPAQFVHSRAARRSTRATLAGEGQVIETDKLRIKDLKAQGYSDQQITNLGLTTQVEPSGGLNAPTSAKPLALQ